MVAKFQFPIAKVTGPCTWLSQKATPKSAPTKGTLLCPEIAGAAGKLVILTDSLQELLQTGTKIFGIPPANILTVDGAEVEDVKAISDGDYLDKAAIQKYNASLSEVIITTKASRVRGLN
ncbi:hypothetical protein MLD38_014386 [Melastoma candidum]|uniref:Uncharacterized protein n=1 Tax=Melastoma candidum TaxID=119954 RepID=A0ACB9RCK2_9MYRT|nr:hypothetical protein MLD38_014386 [Melastoma candidum]